MLYLIQMNRSALFLLTLVTLGLIAYSVHSYLTVKSGEEDLNYLSQQVSQLQDKVTEREGALAYYRSPEFIYKEALEQLGFTRPGEVIPVLKDLEGKGLTIEEESAADATAIATAEPIPYWKLWRTLFFEN